MNHHAGFSDVDDDLPPRFFAEGGTNGDNLTIPPLSREEFVQARAAYYLIRGLDEHGRPTAEKADELRLTC